VREAAATNETWGKTLDSWSARDWMHVEPETPHEAFLARFPSLNAFSVQMV
jgi:hypothetical protein